MTAQSDPKGYRVLLAPLAPLANRLPVPKALSEQPDLLEPWVQQERRVPQDLPVHKALPVPLDRKVPQARRLH